jgi:hypothetical protein
MNVMIRNRIRADLLALAVSMIFFYGMVAIADANGWSRHAHAAVAAGTLAIMKGSWLWFIGAAERRRRRRIWRRRAGVAWRWLRRQPRLPT